MQENLWEAERRIEEARKTGAKSLDLGVLGLSELPASLGDLPHLRALYLGRVGPDETGKLAWHGGRAPSKLTDLSPLAGLQELESLNLETCRDLTDLAPIAGLRALQNLNLSFCTAVTDLAPIAGLRALQNLYLSFCRAVTDLTPIAGLQALQTLYLLRMAVTDLAPIAGLQALQNLYLASTAVTDLVPIAGLQALQNLNLSSTAVTDLAPIAGLQALQNLNLSSTAVTDLAPIAGLQALQNLNLSSTAVTDLAPIAGLQALQNLNLSSTAVTDLVPIAGLQALQNLNLSSTAVTDLAPIAGLQALQNLYLSSTAVTDLAPIAGLQALQNLYLSDCKAVTDLAPLGELRGLETLYLFGCRPPIPPKLLRIFADHPRLTGLDADEATGVPREVLSRRYEDNCLSRLRAYLSELDLGAEAENEVKVILLGNGRVGKTQLCRRFRDEPFDDAVPSTHGVQLWREELHFPAGGEERVFQVNWWDFGGQDIYHGTHALFLRSRAVFLILWTPELENRDEHDENGIPLRNQQLSYWLDYVRSLTGEGSPVIVVQSRCDRFEDRRPDPTRPAGLGFFECCFYSAKEDTGRATLESQLHNAIGYLLERNGALEIGRGRAEVRRRLYAWRGEDQQRESAERQHRTLSLDQFRALCDEVGDIVSWEHALDYFHQTGVVFYDQDLFASRIVLDQTWALDAVYTVFHRGRAAPFLRDSGRFTREDLDLLAWQKHTPEEQTLFLGLMESCGVCFQCGTTDHGERSYIAPDLLPGFETVKRKAALQNWKEESGTPTLRLEYRFFHPAIIRGLMSEIGQQAADFAEYWRYGLWIKDGKRDAQLLLHFLDTSTDEAPGAGALELKAQGGDALGLLRAVRRAILWQRIGEKPEERLTLNGTTVARSALSTRTDDGRARATGGSWVAAEPFAAFFEGREHHVEDAPATGEAPKLDIVAQPPAPQENSRAVFISYAWGDDSPEGKNRTQVVDALQKALARDGFRPLRDRDQIKDGDLISAFIRDLTRADLVVAVISDKYLRSTYCMHEIYKLRQRCQGESEELAKRVVPIVLPDVKIGTFEDRAPYLEHWSERAEKLEALIRNPKLKASKESWEEVRLIRAFAEDVDGILVFLNDVLMPRRLEAHLDQGFPAVLDAVRRRAGLS